MFQIFQGQYSQAREIDEYVFKERKKELSFLQHSFITNFKDLFQGLENIIQHKMCWATKTDLKAWRNEANVNN